MKKESVSYEIMIDLIANIVKKSIYNETITSKEVTNSDNKEVESVCMH